MRKRKIALITALIMIFTMIPTAAFAGSAETDIESKVPKHKYKLLSTYSGYLEEEKQNAKEYLDQDYFETVDEKSRYCDKIWQEIQIVYKKIRDDIENAKDLYEIELAVLQGAEILECVATLTKNKVTEGSDAELQALKKKYLDDIQKYMNAAKPSNYNNYNWDLLEDSAYMGTRIISEATTFRETVWGYYYAVDGRLASSTNAELDEYREEAEMDAEDEFSYLIKSDYTAAEWKTIVKVYNREIARLKTAETMEEIEEIAFGIWDQMFNALEVNKDFNPQLSDILIDKLFAALVSYDEDDYSSKGNDRLEDIFYEAEEELSYALTNYAEQKAYDRAIAKMEAVPTYAEELAAAKKSAKTTLNKYVGNSKYVQSKVKPIVKAGKTAIDKCTTLSSVSKTLKTYKAKAEATIKKFKITSSATKGGTITASKTVKYGKSAVFKIKAKSGYKLSKLIVDGKQVKKTSKYTFKNVKKKHTIKAVFKKR